MRPKRPRQTDQKPQDEIEEALLRRALGFQQQEIYAEDLIDKNSGEILDQAKRKIVTKEIAPDVRALLFWLKNRKPERWRERLDPPPETPDYTFDDTEENL